MSCKSFLFLKTIYTPINVFFHFLFVCAPLFPNQQTIRQQLSGSNPRLEFLGAVFEGASNIFAPRSRVQPSSFIHNICGSYCEFESHSNDDSYMHTRISDTNTDILQTSRYYTKYLKPVSTMFAVSYDNFLTGETELQRLFPRPVATKRLECLGWFNLPLSSDISDVFNRRINSFIEEFPKAFPSGTFQEFKDYLLSVVDNNRQNEGIDRNYKKIEDYITEEPLPLEMSNNTCYLVSLLHLIKTNIPLMDFLIKNCLSHEYRNILIDLLSKPTGEISDEEFELISTFTEEYFATKKSFPRGVQSDPIEFLAEILRRKCELSTLQFFFFNDFNLIEYHQQEFKPIWGSPLVPQFSSYPGEKALPIINISLGHQNSIGPFNIQNMLYGTQYVNSVMGHGICYSLPLFLNSPPFLIINLQYEINTNQSCSAEVQSTSDFLEHNPLIFQDFITVRSLEDGETGYQLTGFIMNEAKHVASTHYIPFYKFKDEWYSYYMSVRSQKGEHDFKFPLIMEYNDIHRITALFYAKLY